jgi:prolyl-tRNA synthetase
MDVNFTDKEGKKQPIWLASYGIGLTRAVGAIVEIHHDEKGIIWPKEVAPYDVHLVHIEDSTTEKFAKEVNDTLTKNGIEVLWDDRVNVSPGAKFADADLIGIPVRLVVSKRNKDKIEFKERKSNKSELLTLEEVVKKLKEPCLSG